MRKILALLALVVSIFILASCGSSHGVSTSDKKQVSLLGEWKQVNSDPTGWMTASISGESIQVNLIGRDSSSIFWMGTFDTSPRSAKKFNVVSLADQDAMKWVLTASTESKKTFAYDHGVLSFEFSALGSSTIIHMTQTKQAHIPSATPKTKKAPTVKPKSKSPKVTTRKPPKVSLGKKK